MIKLRVISLLEFELPDTGEGVTEGTFLEWLVEEGEDVEEDQTIAEVETDKAVVDVPSPASGSIKELRAEPGDTVDVGEVIMVMETEGESDGTEAEPGEDEGQEQVDTREDNTEEVEGSTNSNTDTGDILALPKVRKIAEEKDVDLSRIQGSGPDGRIIGEDVLEATGDKSAAIEETESEENETVKAEENTEAPANVDVKATPAVRQLAREKGVNLEKVDGSGRGGKIIRQDVIEATGETQASERTVTEEGGVERVEMSGIRRSVADKMEKSRFTAPHVTHVEKADVTELVELREEKKEEVDAHLTYLPFIMKSVLVGLKDYPDLNAELDEERGEIIRKKYYDFNIAVDTDRGLMVPVVEDIDERSIVELAEKIDEVVEKTREEVLSSEDMTGGTFTVTNLGVIGGEEFTPIINYPQVAILGIGKIEETAEVVDGEIVPRHTVKLSLSYDHRVVDGATAARFMNTVVENLEDPGELLMEI